MRFHRTIRILLSVVLVAAAAWLGRSAELYAGALVNAFFAIALLSVPVIHFRVRPSRLDALLVLAGTFLLAGIDFRILHFKPAIMAWPSFVGLTSLLILGLRAVWAKDADRKMLLLAFVPALLFVTSEYFAVNLLQFTAKAHPKAFDLYLFYFDSSLRVQIPFLLGQAFALYPWFRFTGLLFYVGLPIPIALIYSGRLIRTREKALPSFIAFLSTGPIGVIFYNILPALGPGHLFGNRFPWRPLTVEQTTRLFLEPIAIPGPPNAIPSLHMAWVLLAWWYSRGLSWWERVVAFAFVFFTILATMGTGEHYFVDLVVAFPFAMLIEALCSFELPAMNRTRLAAAGIALVTTLAWMEALRYTPHFFWRAAWIPWTLCAVTIAISIFCETKLWNAAAEKRERKVAPPQQKYGFSEAAHQPILDERA